MSNADSDESLVLAAQAGDLDAWSRLCRRHVPRLAAYIGCRLRRPAVVDKLVAEVVAAAWENLNEVKNAHEFPAWFRRVGGNLAMQWCRKNPGEPLSELFPAERCGGDETLRRRMERLEAALALLTDQQRMALEQRFRGGMDPAALSESLHLPDHDVERLLDEALIALDQALGVEPL